jgi:hypothetical protein
VQLFFILLAVVVFFLLFVKLIAALMGRVTERMLTSYFRALEALVERDTLPPDWSEQLRRMARRGNVRTRLIQSSPWQEAAKPFLMKKIRDLRNYFERSRFVEGPEAREVLLETLDAVRDRWEASELPEILAYYDLALDAR